jgi:hypothetical protein
MKKKYKITITIKENTYTLYTSSSSEYAAMLNAVHQLLKEKKGLWIGGQYHTSPGLIIHLLTENQLIQVLELGE